MKHNRYIKPSQRPSKGNADAHHVAYLIGYGLLGIALLLIAIGVATA